MAKKKKETALVSYDQEFADLAKQYASQAADNLGGGLPRISLGNGVMSINDDPIPNNEIAVIILDSIHENSYFEDDYVKGEQQSPACYAIARSNDDLKPHNDAESPQAENCGKCALNAFGSKGRGKACGNRERLIVISAGTLKRGSFEAFNAEDLKDSEMYFLKVPPTSLRGYAEYTKELTTGLLKLPPVGAITKISVAKPKKGEMGTRLNFEFMEPVNKQLIQTVMEKRKQALDYIDTPFPKFDSSEPKKKSKGVKRKERKY